MQIPEPIGQAALHLPCVGLCHWNRLELELGKLPGLDQPPRAVAAVGQQNGHLSGAKGLWWALDLDFSWLNMCHEIYLTALVVNLWLFELSIGQIPSRRIIIIAQLYTIMHIQVNTITAMALKSGLS